MMCQVVRLQVSCAWISCPHSFVADKDRIFAFDHLEEPKIARGPFQGLFTSGDHVVVKFDHHYPRAGEP